MVKKNGYLDDFKFVSTNLLLRQEESEASSGQKEDLVRTKQRKFSLKIRPKKDLEHWNTRGLTTIRNSDLGVLAGFFE